MPKKYYFQYSEDEQCYPLSYFKEKMIEDNLNEITLIEAEKMDVTDYFWCSEYYTVGEKGECGKFCKKYEPRNGKSGCCKHYSTQFYELSDKKITIRMKK